MSTTVWFAADTVYHPQGGGHRWMYLNWVLGLRALGCEVVWLEGVDPAQLPDDITRGVAALKVALKQYGLEDSIALCSRGEEPLPPDLTARTVPLEAAHDADLLLNMAYVTVEQALPLFRRTALLDTDPGLSHVWASEGDQEFPPHDLYFTMGETVGRPDALFPDMGIPWQHTTPCVALDWWPARPAENGAPFTTVSQWINWGEWLTFGDESFPNDKRTGFLPFIDLPRKTAEPLELALLLEADERMELPPWEQEERARLEERGWRVVHAYAVAGTTWDYQEYVGSSRGEFGWARPSCMRLQNAWISERTLCYLASGKPAVVQHTGPSEILPDGEGVFRFRDVDEAARHLDTVAADYEKHSVAARALAEEVFDARKVVGSVLERSL